VIVAAAMTTERAIDRVAPALNMTSSVVGSPPLGGSVGKEKRRRFNRHYGPIGAIRVVPDAVLQSNNESLSAWLQRPAQRDFPRNINNLPSQQVINSLLKAVDDVALIESLHAI
jgi:hypothetical protein